MLVCPSLVKANATCYDKPLVLWSVDSSSSLFWRALLIRMRRYSIFAFESECICWASASSFRSFVGPVLYIAMRFSAPAFTCNPQKTNALNSSVGCHNHEFDIILWNHDLTLSSISSCFWRDWSLCSKAFELESSMWSPAVETMLSPGTDRDPDTNEESRREAKYVARSISWRGILRATRMHGPSILISRARNDDEWKRLTSICYSQQIATALHAKSSTHLSLCGTSQWRISFNWSFIF